MPRLLSGKAIRPLPCGDMVTISNLKGEAYNVLYQSNT